MSRVLIIDDEAAFRAMARRLLESEGHEVVEASTGQEGIDCFRTLSPEIIVTDIFMPGKSGIETITQIRQENAEVRIIAVSGNGDMASGDFLSAAMAVGADETLAKPFRAKQFIEAVEKPGTRSAI